jgi:DNA-binding NtrC family response regulator
MIRILLFTQDIKFHHVLRPTLGTEFKVAVECNRDALSVLLIAGVVDVLVLDVDAERDLHDDLYSILDEVTELQVPTLVMTDDECRSATVALLERGAYDYFRKPPVLPELRIIIRRAHEHALLKKEVKAARQQLNPAAECGELIGSSARSLVIYDMIRRVANLNTYVLITGESGTGKELIARAIHNLSDRARRPFVAVSCGAIPESLVEAELFGHEKGAFTGSTGPREGYLEQAADGTLLLDEIGELSQYTQVKLLRVLQQREFSRLGSSKLIPLRARVLFATHRDLGQMVREQKFRQDLYFRVNVMRIYSPALRERPEDIVPLANHFLRTYSAACRKPVESIRPAAIALLLAYDWPGNVRELENVIQSAIILTESETIGPEDLPEHLQQRELLDLCQSLPGTSFEDQLRSYKIQLAMKAIENCSGNKTLAARSLSISRAYLHKLIRDSGSERESFESWESAAQ